MAATLHHSLPTQGPWRAPSSPPLPQTSEAATSSKQAALHINCQQPADAADTAPRLLPVTLLADHHGRQAGPAVCPHHGLHWGPDVPGVHDRALVHVPLLEGAIIRAAQKLQQHQLQDTKQARQQLLETARP